MLSISRSWLMRVQISFHARHLLSIFLKRSHSYKPERYRPHIWVNRFTASNAIHILPGVGCSPWSSACHGNVPYVLENLNAEVSSCILRGGCHMFALWPKFYSETWKSSFWGKKIPNSFFRCQSTRYRKQESLLIGLRQIATSWNSASKTVQQFNVSTILLIQEDSSSTEALRNRSRTRSIACWEPTCTLQT